MALTYDEGTVALNRAKLEREGAAGHRRRTTSSTPCRGKSGCAEKARAPGRRRACLAAFGLTLPCKIADVKRVFRARVKQAHPDQGGDAEAFIRLRSAYAEALRFVERHREGQRA